MSRASTGAAVLLAAALALVGCSAVAPSAPAPTITAKAATGPTISGTGYTFAVPEDWGVPDPVPGFDPDALAADLDDTDGFADNVNVILSPAGAVTADQVETAGVDELKNGGAKDVTVRDRVTIAGAESAHLAASLDTAGEEYAIEQFYATNDGQTYIVTFSFSPSVSQGERDDIADSILASWTWT
jgi:hypothetical protein